jgi:uncharacterized protein YcnI
VSRKELLEFEKFQQLEAEGVFSDERNHYLLSALCHIYIWYFSAKAEIAADELAAHFGNPYTVRMRIPTEEELKKFAERKIAKDKKVFEGLIALAQIAKERKEIQEKKKSKPKPDLHQQCFKELKDVH